MALTRRSADHRGAGDRHRAGGHSAGRRARRHSRARPVRPRLRDVHPALRGRRGGGRRARRAAGGRPAPGGHRGHHPDDPLFVLLAQRSRAEQRAVGHRPGAVGHHRQAGRHAGLRAARRPQPGRRSRSTPTPPARHRGDPGPGGKWSRRAARVRLQVGHRGPAPTARRARPAATRGRRIRTAGTSSSTCAARPRCSQAGRERLGDDVEPAARRAQPADAEAGGRAGAGRSSRTGCSSSRTSSRPSTTTGCPRSAPPSPVPLAVGEQLGSMPGRRTDGARAAASTSCAATSRRSAA